MSNHRHIIFSVVNIKLYALDSSLKVLKISFDLGVAGKLIASKICVVGRVAKVVSQRQILIKLLLVCGMIYSVVFKKGAKIIETQRSLNTLQYSSDVRLCLTLFCLQKSSEIFWTQMRFEKLTVIF